MPATMFTVIQTVSGSGKPKRHSVTLPRIDSLLDEKLKYFTLPDEPAEERNGPMLGGDRREA